MAQSSAFQSVQLVALALPAVALYLKLLTTLFSEPEQYKMGTAVVLTQADGELPFAVALGCLLSFLLSAIFLVGGLVYPSQILVTAGDVLLILALFLFAGSVALLLRDRVLPEVRRGRGTILSQIFSKR
jgi:hypothetical protein